MSRFYLATGLAIVLTACGTKSESPESMERTEDLGDVEQTMQNALLAEVEVDGATVSFYEYESGEVVVAALAPDGSLPSLGSGETLQEVFEAVAPGREVPEKILSADARLAQVPLEDVADEDLYEPEPIAAAGRSESTELLSESIGQAQQALASSIDWNWFSYQFCEGWYEGVEGFAPWCMPLAYNNAYAQAKRREAWGVACGDTGSVRLILDRSGSTIFYDDIPYGYCRAARAWYKRPRTWKYRLAFVQQSARFGGEMGNDKQYFPPPGW